MASPKAPRASPGRVATWITSPKKETSGHQEPPRKFSGKRNQGPAGSAQLKWTSIASMLQGFGWRCSGSSPAAPCRRQGMKNSGVRLTRRRLVFFLFLGTHMPSLRSPDFNLCNTSLDWRSTPARLQKSLNSLFGMADCKAWE